MRLRMVQALGAGYIDGIIDLAGLWRDVRRAGYAGPIEVEIFSDHWWAQPPEQVLALALNRCAQIFGSMR